MSICFKAYKIDEYFGKQKFEACTPEELESLRQQLDGLQRKHNQLSKDHQRLQREYDILQGDHENLAESFQQLRLCTDELQFKHNSLQSKLEDIPCKFGHDLAALQDQISKIVYQITSTLDKGDWQIIFRKGIDKSIKSMQFEVQNASKEIEKLKELLLAAKILEGNIQELFIRHEGNIVKALQEYCEELRKEHNKCVKTINKSYLAASYFLPSILSAARKITWFHNNKEK